MARKSTKTKVMMQVGDYAPVFLTSFKCLSEAEAYIRIQERHDKYEQDVEGYGFPHGLPKYFTA